MSANRPRRAFTLVELLIVIVIIGMLVALLIPAITAVIRRAADFRAGTDIANLASAVEAYNTKYGDYPPDFSELRLLSDPDDLLTPAFNQSSLIGHLRKAFPKIAPAEVTALKGYLHQELSAGRLPGPAHALYFWLGGLSANVQRPFTGAGGPLIVIPASGGNPARFVLRTQERHEPLFTFDEGRMQVNSTETLVSYKPKSFNAPYVYFDHDTYSTAAFIYESGNWAVPYTTIVSDRSNPPTVNFVNRNKFQIISAGKDDLYAAQIMFDDANGNPMPLYTTDKGRPYHPVEHPNPNAASNNATINQFFVGQEDNLTNFSEGERLISLQES